MSDFPLTQQRPAAGHNWFGLAKMLVGRTAKEGVRFNLVAWFAITSLACIALISAISAHVQSHYLTQEVLRRDATVTKEFVESILRAENTWSYFSGSSPGQSNPQLESFFNHVSNMPDVMGANVFDAHGKVLWSSTPNLVGRSYTDNDELQDALQGELVFESGEIGATDKEEHAELKNTEPGQWFVETYVPIWNNSGTRILGAVELYKVPRALQQSLHTGRWMVWAVAAAGGSLLFVCLFWIVSRASRTIAVQNERLMEMESLAMIGETAAAVTHGIRNPLASIRASAEMALIDDLDGARESARDIIAESDRLNGWTRDLLAFSRAYDGPLEPVDVNALLEAVLEQHQCRLVKSGIVLSTRLAADNPMLQAAFAPLSQALGSVVTNALEAMPDGGRLSVSTENKDNGRLIVMTIVDDGPGMSKETLQNAPKPFFSTKPSGTGLGLPLTRQIIERFGGQLELSSEVARGLTVTVSVPTASIDH